MRSQSQRFTKTWPARGASFHLWQISEGVPLVRTLSKMILTGSASLALILPTAATPVDGQHLLPSACALSAGKAENIDRTQAEALATVQALMAARLTLMTQVAQTKWNTGAPIEDPAREQQLLDDIRLRAAQANLSPDWVVHFFRLQVEAGKEIQYMLFAQWDSEERGKFDHPVDLRADIRPRLDQMTPKLIGALSVAWPAIVSGKVHLKSCSPRALISGAGCVTPLSLVPLMDGSARADQRRTVTPIP